MQTKTTTALAVAVVVGLAVAAAALVLGPDRITPSDERTGDEALAARLAEHAESGHRNIAAFTVAGDEVTFAGLGADEHTEFEIGSVTKTFTAQILTNQIEAGRVTLDTTVGEIIDAGDAAVADVTLRELADHTSGLPRLGGSNGIITSVVTSLTGANPYEGTSPEDVIDDALTASLSGRGEFDYSNLGVALLGQLLAVEADTTYGHLLDEQILEPLGMTDTYLMETGTVPADAPRGLLTTGRVAQPWEMDGYGPTGGLRSTPADMARWARFLLDSGVPEITWGEGPDGSHSHNGGTYGYSSTLIVDPEQQRAVFTVGDTMHDVDAVADHLWKEQ